MYSIHGAVPFKKLSMSLGRKRPLFRTRCGATILLVVFSEGMALGLYPAVSQTPAADGGEYQRGTDAGCVHIMRKRCKHTNRAGID